MIHSPEDLTAVFDGRRIMAAQITCDAWHKDPAQNGLNTPNSRGVLEVDLIDLEAGAS